MSKYLVLATVALSLFAARASAQSPASVQNLAKMQKIAASQEAWHDATSTDLHQRLEEAGVARAVAERQLQLRRDTDKLVALTAELKQNVDKTGTNILSMDVIKKAAEIQKLAKSVEDKMKNAY
jgi:predicted TIM-barrel fold metal-dependent hydrolase